MKGRKLRLPVLPGSRPLRFNEAGPVKGRKHPRRPSTGCRAARRFNEAGPVKGRKRAGAMLEAGWSLASMRPAL